MIVDIVVQVTVYIYIYIGVLKSHHMSVSVPSARANQLRLDVASLGEFLRSKQHEHVS